MAEEPISHKINELHSYTDRFAVITLFEIRQLFGSSLFALVIFVLTLPLFFFSTQWIVLPLSALIIVCGIWYFFGQKLWLPDAMKRLAIPSKAIRAITSVLLRLMEQQNNWLPYSQKL